ncbi:MAG TPA: M14 family metallopeptidase [Bacteroidales bacterium]|nr:M14 family metallopeptidase [Bacteroidales bacterium]
MKRLLLISLTLILSVILQGQEPLEYFLADGIKYNKDIPTPLQFFGHEPGEWHLSHDRLYAYITELAEKSDRAVWEEYGRSYENRPLGNMIISSPENIRNIEQLRMEHLKLCDPAISSGVNVEKMPVFIKLGYGIHGNESSSQNSSIVIAYYLIAGEGEKIDHLLENCVILIDPSLNPDGMQRHSSWVNSARSLNNNPDSDSWEFAETWPGGRTNHYWFDLNRDYLFLQHPETKGRIAAFYMWRPNIVTDHHEMDAGSTFFFQPGVQKRNNPLTPSDIHQLTTEVGKYHEKYLNSIGSLYYTEEGFDDYYVGKGSSYPDIHGSVGILFEQAGVKGHLRNTQGGQISFPFAIRNHVVISLSSLDAALNMKTKMLECQREFYRDAIIQADKYPVKAYIFSETYDKYRITEFINILHQHQIRVYRLAKDYTKNGITYKSTDSYIVPLKQNEYRFVRSLFEPVNSFADSAFYDVSTWVLPMAFNLSYSGINEIKSVEGITGEEIKDLPATSGGITGSADPYAYLFEWNDYLAPKALFELQNTGIRVKVATDRFTYNDGTFSKKFSFGTILIHSQGQPVRGKDLYRIIESIARNNDITVYGVSTGLTPEGMDLGSNQFINISQPSVLMFAGDGANSADAGEIWHMLDTRFKMPVTMVTPSRLNNVNLQKYNVIIVTGSPSVSQSFIEKLKAWNRSGGTLIGYENGNRWIAGNKLTQINFIDEVRQKNEKSTYARMQTDRQIQQIPGSIFETRLDLSHPLCYGYTKDLLPVFKAGVTVARKDTVVYNNPVTYTENPLLSGYCTPENIDRIKGSAFASVHGNRIISIYDNTNFRATWYGTNKIFMNAIFFGQLLGRGGADYEE